jgi:ribosomal-protein-alanine N-acetyltransferase
MIISTSIYSERFVLKTLDPVKLSAAYLDWFSDPVVNQFIEYKKPKDMFELSDYIVKKNLSKDALMLGIFFNNLHIGNIKYEPIDLKLKRTIMGILIGDNEWRGKGVSAEVLSTTTKYLKKNYDIEEFYLGVHQENLGAIKAYKKAGFNEFIGNEFCPNRFPNLVMKLVL